MTSLDSEEDGLTTIHVAPGSVLGLEVTGVATLRDEHPIQYQALVECAAFVNWRRIERGRSPILALSFCV